MKYVALLSGGKDSCFNLVHCEKNGHELVAAASLRPEQGKEELDSYLYQTVGQDAIELVAKALEVPLYRKTIVGSAVEQGSEYGTRSSSDGVQGDETEDLYDLLVTVKDRHPEIRGVSVGAILSNYQRVRVEHVCRRLSITCLCYLWRRDQEELLSEMIDSGLEAILIKVAGIGLSPKHLGKTLAEMQPILMKLNSLYGSHVCGEGGEFESLTLDCPLFKSRIILKEVEPVIHSDNDFATVAFLRIKDACLEPKSGIISSSLSTPPLLEDEGLRIKNVVEETRKTESAPSQKYPGAAHSMEIATGIRVQKIGQWIAVSNVQVEPIEDNSVEDEVQNCFELLKEHLSSHGFSLSHSVNINLFLSNMEYFPRVNSVYSTFFGTSPPARACVAVDLPHRIRIRMDCTALKESPENTMPTIQRQSLHVQSQSYWAPANIGPYSQAIVAGERIFISGQIGLIPSSVTLPEPRSSSIEMALATQHTDKIVNVLKNSWEGYNQSAIYWLDDVANLSAVRKASGICSKDEVGLKLFVVVKALPKGALVEKQVMFHTGRAWVSEPDIDARDGEEHSLKPLGASYTQSAVLVFSPIGA
ncbi:hypothetical protein L218DRAFT_984324 [Marasmius fiardii PR-910]|nr:hypothetical protein L218DRAFT_984324 [Marasmius fiardii PR-910]